MEHKTDLHAIGGKAASGSKADILKELLSDLNIEIKAKGYKSSEGDETFDPPSEDERQPQSLPFTERR